MPKDATKNVDRYKVRGGELNEFDFHQNQEAYATEKKQPTGKQLIPAKPQKGTKAAKKKATKGASPKKLAARKAAKKK
jgi:hypothetical protein